MEDEQKLFIFTDGGARGNPGPAAVGVFITDSAHKIHAQISKAIGITTNNVAEYRAVITAFEWLHVHQKELARFSEVCFYLDSQLVVSQLNGVYKIKSPHLRPLIAEIKAKERLLDKPVAYEHIPREKNKQADRLVNKAFQ